MRKPEDTNEPSTPWYMATNASLIAEGVAKWGWSPDAACHNCGDTGHWPKYPSALCNCDAGRRLTDERREQQVMIRRGMVWAATGVPPHFSNFTLTGHPNQRAVAQAREWLPGREPTNVLICGSVGTGKTGLACALLRWMVSQDRSGMRFWAVPDLLDEMRPQQDADATDPRLAARTASVLVLDDLGVQRTSEWVLEQLNQLFNARYAAGLPTIVTTNLDIAGLRATLGDRIMSRLGERMVVIEMTGSDLRLVGV